MKFTEIFKVAHHALYANKIRTILTMLGVIIGVSSVILLMSIGRGVQNYITDIFAEMGSNLVFVTPGNRKPGEGDPSAAFGNMKLEEKHVKLLLDNDIGFIDKISGNVQTSLVAKYKTNSFYSDVLGLNEEGESIFNYSIKEGRSFNKSEIRSRARVAVLGSKTKDELFKNQSAIGKRIKISDKTFTVIGEYKEKGKSFDSQIIMPITTAIDTYNIKNYVSISIKIKNENEVDTAMSYFKKILKKDLKEEDFSVISQKEMLNSVQSIMQILTIGLGAIAGISLVVGGIGIMNIMLVSVTERTKEIGLRKALGATSQVVTTQFLLEAVLLSIGGGTAGIIIGVLLSFIPRFWIRTEVTFMSILIAFLFSAVVGIIFGTYPAIQASKKDPIEALRYE